MDDANGSLYYLTYFILAIGIYFMVSFLGVDVGIGPMEFVFIMVGSGAILICVIALASVLTALWTFKKGLDPDAVKNIEKIDI